MAEVILTDKDCAEIAAVKDIFINARHKLCHFHKFKSVDVRLKKANLESNYRKQIYDSFKRAVYAKTVTSLEKEEDFLIGLGNIYAK